MRCWPTLPRKQRDEAALRQYAPLAEELAARYSHTLYQAIAHRAWGVAHCLAGDYAESEGRLLNALELFEHLGTRWQNTAHVLRVGNCEARRI